MFRRKTALIEKTEMTIGEFDPTVDGAYRNVKTFPLEVKAGKDLYISIESSIPVDIALSNGDGMCIGFKDQFKSGVFGPTALKKKEVVSLMMGVFRGDLAKLTIEAWME